MQVLTLLKKPSKTRSWKEGRPTPLDGQAWRVGLWEEDGLLHLAFGLPRFSVILCFGPACICSFILSLFVGFIVSFCFICFAVLGMESRPLHLLGGSQTQHVVPGILYPQRLFLGLGDRAVNKKSKALALCNLFSSRKHRHQMQAVSEEYGTESKVRTECGAR